MISLRNVTVAYGDHVVYDRLSLEIPDGRITGVLGSNGAGKTTLMKALVDRLPASGDITIAGLKHTQFRRRHRRDLFYLPEQGFTYDYLRAREFVRFVLDLYEAPDREGRAWRLLEAFSLDPDGDQLVREFSQGMKRKLFLTPFLAMEPKVLLLDEAMNGIDAVGLAVLKKVLQGLAAGGSAVVLSSHVPDFIEKAADEVLILRRGQVGFHGAVSTLDRPLEQHYLDVLGLDVEAQVAEFLSPGSL